MKRIYSTNKPVIISLGMWDSKKFPSVPAKSRTKFLYCVSKYPTPFEDIYFDKIDFKKYDGFSDHTIGISASIAAIAMGAGIIEKHLTMNKKMYGPDHICSGTPKELKEICKFRDDFEKMS
jgi:sialic acid synthase SpsE